jgi:hypothetical protein
MGGSLLSTDDVLGVEDTYFEEGNCDDGEMVGVTMLVMCHEACVVCSCAIPMLP